MHPLFNLREICKQCALLEDHLNNPRKRCHDCIRKHFLTIEGLFEEAVSLDKDRKWSKLTDGKADYVRRLQERWIDGTDCRDIAQSLREVRKDFAPECFDLRAMKLGSVARGGKTTLRAHLAAVFMGLRAGHVCG